jgi:hypothetical protein
MIHQCCQCRKIEVDGHWVYPRFSQLDGQDVSHGYCPTCFAAVKRQIQANLHAASVLTRWKWRFAANRVQPFGHP